MKHEELKALAYVMLAIADGAEWECQWADGWHNPCGRDLEFCIGKRIPIRLKTVDDRFIANKQQGKAS